MSATMWLIAPVAQPRIPLPPMIGGSSVRA
jgi:hypothetical protein